MCWFNFLIGNRLLRFRSFIGRRPRCRSLAPHEYNQLAAHQIPGTVNLALAEDMGGSEAGNFHLARRHRSLPPSLQHPVCRHLQGLDGITVNAGNGL